MAAKAPRPDDAGDLAEADDRTKATRSWLGPISLLVAGKLSLAVVLAITTGLLVRSLHQHAMLEAEHRLRSLSIILADQAERTFEGVALVQTGLLARLRSGTLNTPDDVVRQMSGAAAHEALRGMLQGLPQLDAISVLDADGNLINMSRDIPLPSVNAADRDYFVALKADPALTTFIGTPVLNRATATWTIFLTRKITAPDGAFLGVILGAMRLSAFEELYKSVATGADSAISMFRRDGVLLARYPSYDDKIGVSFGQNLVLNQLEEGSAQPLVMRKTSSVDGQDRLIAAKSMLRYPVVVNVTDSVSAILSDWRKQALYLIAAAALLEGVAIVSGLLVRRQLNSQRLLDVARAVNAKAHARLSIGLERENAARLMDTQNQRFAAAIANMSQALCMFDSAGTLTVVNRRLTEMFGVPRDSVAPGAHISALLGPPAAQSNLCMADKDMMRHNVEAMRLAGVRTAVTLELADGRTLAVNYVPAPDNSWLLTLEDITERRSVAARMAHMAHHDALTGLPNRVLFHEKLIEAVARSRRGQSCAVLFLDLDNFKTVNDTLGHPLGDNLLRAVTLRLQAQVRETDCLGRLGGDEFAVVQASVDQPDDATALAVRLIRTVSAPFDLDGHQVMIGTSIGIAVVPTDGEDADTILKNADLALYRAKADGRGRYRFFEPEMDALMQARRALEMDLRKALGNHEFELFYQPLINLRTGTVSGFEALLRWRHPVRGLVQPNDFIPLAEEIGVIVPVGEWVLRRACADAVTWPDKMKVAVNVSVTQFASRTLVADVVDALAVTGLEPERLELEITETVMLDDTDAVLVVLHQLRDLGVCIAMDDFGTGYSSLSYLRRFPFSKVKIDRSFIQGLGTGGDCDAIVTAVTDLCRSLGMTTLAEGVETEAQLKQLRASNCGEAQGYLFSRPRPASDVAELCRTLGPPEPSPVDV